MLLSVLITVIKSSIFLILCYVCIVCSANFYLPSEYMKYFLCSLNAWEVIKFLLVHIFIICRSCLHILVGIMLSCHIRMLHFPMLLQNRVFRLSSVLNASFIFISFLLSVVARFLFSFKCFKGNPNEYKQLLLANVEEMNNI